MQTTLLKIHIKLAHIILCFCGAAVLMAGASVDAQDVRVNEDESPSS